MIWEDPSGKNQKNATEFQVHYKPDKGDSVSVDLATQIQVYLDLSGTAEPADWSYQIAPATHFKLIGSQILNDQLVVTLESTKAGGTLLNGQVFRVQVAAVDDNETDSPEVLTFTLNSLRPADFVETQQVIGQVWGQKDDFTIQIKENHAPVSLDLDGDGVVSYLIASDGVCFDFNHDGQPEATPWVGPQDGLLAYDYNHDGVITEGREIVFTAWGTDETAQTDLQALSRYFDSNANGLLDNKDATWQHFGVWQDADSDGINDPGEFYNLDALGITSIDLLGDGNASSMADGEVLIHGTTTVSYVDDSTGIAQDVTFAALLDHALADPGLFSGGDAAPLATTEALLLPDADDLTALVDAYMASEPVVEVPISAELLLHGDDHADDPSSPSPELPVSVGEPTPVLDHLHDASTDIPYTDHSLPQDHSI